MVDTKPKPDVQDARTSFTSRTRVYDPIERIEKVKNYNIVVPNLDELLATEFPERRHLLSPWLREQESVMLYAATGVGKSLFAMSVALAVAGNGKFLGWRPEMAAGKDGYKVFYVDGEMHIGDIQDRARMLLDAVEDVDRKAAGKNIRIIARQHQEPGVEFPSITDPAGMDFYVNNIQKWLPDLVVLDNFSTLGEVDDENSASSFNRIQDFLLKLKTLGVATILVHHAGKTGDFRGSSKLAATFETIISLERGDRRGDIAHAAFNVEWVKVRLGGGPSNIQTITASLEESPPREFGETSTVRWEYEKRAQEPLDFILYGLKSSSFSTQKEIADIMGITPTMVKKYLDKGERLGWWTKTDVHRWLGLGKAQRKRREASQFAPTGSPEDRGGTDAAGVVQGGTEAAPTELTGGSQDCPGRIRDAEPECDF